MVSGIFGSPPGLPGGGWVLAGSVECGRALVPAMMQQSKGCTTMGLPRMVSSKVSPMLRNDGNFGFGDFGSDSPAGFRATSLYVFILFCCPVALPFRNAPKSIHV